ncbi:MAG TPA: ATP-binding protein [Verrucomicrobiae bacterium]|nr:ATP-binding protein [Verrucomicrobiae bacterium]
MAARSDKREAQAQRARLQRQTRKANEQLVIAAVRQHELREATEKLNGRLQLEIADRIDTEERLQAAQAQLADRAKQLEMLVQSRTANLTRANESLKKEITERERTEILLQQQTAKLQETIGELEGFSYGITHDLRAPLRAVQGFSVMLLDAYGEELDDVGKDLLRRIAASVDRMDKLIQDTLVYSRVLQRELQFQVVDVEKLLRGMLESYSDFQEPNADVVIEGQLPGVLGNESLLTQCFSNLLHNAVKFVAPNVKPRVRISAERSAGMVRFWVSDNGVGIDPMYFAKIFEMFQRLKVACEGTGIGLAIVRKAAERMGGQVGVESELGHGSRFWLDLKSADK